MFTSWGVAPGDLARAITFNVVTFWLGYLLTGGLALTLDPLALPGPWHRVAATSRPLGILFLAVLGLYVLSTLRRQRRVRLRGFEVELPGPAMTLTQLGVSSIDWVLAAAVFYVLLPEAAGLSFEKVLGIFLLAQVVGIVSHVPAGLGVFDTAVVLLLAPWLPGDVVLGSALAYRVVYYLIPMGVAVVLFAGWEAFERRETVRFAGGLLAQWAPELVPRFFSITTFVAGTILLLSGAMPAAAGRVEALDRFLPLPILEVSHFLGSLIGVALLLLARGLQQRVDGAYVLTLALLAGGVAVSLGKGLDWEEASILSFMFLALLPCHRFFYRRSSLLSQSFTATWTTGIGLILIATGFVVILAYRHVEYSKELWWQFEISEHAPRSLRGLAGGIGLLGFYSLARLLRPAPPVPAPADPAILERVLPVVKASPRSTAFLALLGDKQILLHESSEGFVMYGVSGRSWVSMGDPVGPSEVRRELVWRFHELADQHGGLTVFYEVGADDLPLYVDLGLALRKLGEEARVPLQGFSLTGGARKNLRQAHHRAERDGCSFEVVPPTEVGALLDELESISNEWLARKRTREKRFSLGFFDRQYLQRTPLALVRVGRRIVAFANVWAGDAEEECSLDLMRYVEDAPAGVMEYLFAELILWGQAQGHRWLSLGMAPLSGFERHRLAPLWNRLGALLFRYGEHFYNFQGLRAFKEKFDPCWEPRYLASPGGLALPLVLTHVSALISRGVAGTVVR
jgi:phosphatidylglycerol lysyltransferase